MKRIAVIFEENIFDRKGSFNAKCARVRHLAELTGWQIDVFCIQLFQDAFVSSMLGMRTLDIRVRTWFLKKNCGNGIP